MAVWQCRPTRRPRKPILPPRFVAGDEMHVYERVNAGASKVRGWG